jgi:hypothetical protein
LSGWTPRTARRALTSHQSARVTHRWTPTTDCTADLPPICACNTDGPPPPIVPRRIISQENGHAVFSPAEAAAGSAPPIMPRGRSASVQRATVDLTKFQWFAGDCTREEAEVLMKDHPDGTFLIRHSRSHGGYSLSVKYVRAHASPCLEALEHGSWPALANMHDATVHSHKIRHVS